MGQVIAGRYTLLEVLGEGGMGTVYRAGQTHPVKRQVALKLIISGVSRGSDPNGTRLSVTPIMAKSWGGTMEYQNAKCTSEFIMSFARTS